MDTANVLSRDAASEGFDVFVGSPAFRDRKYPHFRCLQDIELSQHPGSMAGDEFHYSGIE